MLKLLTLTLTAKCPALYAGSRISRVWQEFLVFPCKSPTQCSPSRCWHWIQIFPRLGITAKFPVFDTGYQSFPRSTLVASFRTCHWLHSLSRSVLVASFPALDISCLLSRLSLAPFPIALGTVRIISRAWHSLHIFPRSTMFAYFGACH